MEKMNIIDVPSMPVKQGRKGDGGTYLVVADDSDEFKSALAYACYIAKAHRAHLGILKILENQDFEHWGAVEEQVKRELREQGEAYMWAIAGMANDMDGIIPSLYFAQGNAGEALLKTIDEDAHIIQLILGGGKGNSPGPLVNFCMGKGLDRLRVPVVVVPYHLKDFS